MQSLFSSSSSSSLLISHVISAAPYLLVLNSSFVFVVLAISYFFTSGVVVVTGDADNDDDDGMTRRIYILTTSHTDNRAQKKSFHLLSPVSRLIHLTRQAKFKMFVYPIRLNKSCIIRRLYVIFFCWSNSKKKTFRNLYFLLC